MPYMYAPVTNRPPSPELSLDEQKTAKRHSSLRGLCDPHSRNAKVWNDRRQPTFMHAKRQVLVDLLYTLNYSRVYTEHKICMGKHDWRVQIAEAEGYSVLEYSNDNTAPDLHQLNGWLAHSVSSDVAITSEGNDAGPNSGTFKRVNRRPFQVEQAAEKLKSARYDLEDTADAINHERRRVSVMNGRSGKVREMRLYQPSNDAKRTPPLPKAPWTASVDASSLSAYVPRPSKLRIVVEGQSTHLDARSVKARELLADGFARFDIAFEKFWENQLNAASAKLQLLQASRAAPIAPISLPPSPPDSPIATPTKSRSPVKARSPVKSKSRSPTKKNREDAAAVDKTKVTVSDVLQQRAREHGQGQQQQTLDLDQRLLRLQTGRSSSDENVTQSGSGIGRGRQQERRRSPQKGTRGRALMVPQWEEDSMRTVRREISP